MNIYTITDDEKAVLLTNLQNQTRDSFLNTLENAEEFAITTACTDFSIEDLLLTSSSQILMDSLLNIRTIMGIKEDELTDTPKSQISYDTPQIMLIHTLTSMLNTFTQSLLTGEGLDLTITSKMNEDSKLLFTEYLYDFEDVVSCYEAENAKKIVN